MSSYSDHISKCVIRPQEMLVKSHVQFNIRHTNTVMSVIYGQLLTCRIDFNFTVEVCEVLNKSRKKKHTHHTHFLTFNKLLSKECKKKYALRLLSHVMSCCLCFERHAFSQAPEKKKITWNVFSSMSHTRLHQIIYPVA